jgi:hypothetical protein
VYVAPQGAPTDIQGSDFLNDFWVGRFTGCEISVGFTVLGGWEHHRNLQAAIMC